MRFKIYILIVLEYRITLVLFMKLKWIAYSRLATICELLGRLYHERLSRKKKLSLEEVVERLGGPLGNNVPSSTVPVGKSATRQKSRERSQGKDTGMSGMYVRTYVENLEKYSRNSVKTDVDDRG